MTCARCGREIGQAPGDSCPGCGAPLASRASPSGDGLPWERRASWLDWGALARTVHGCLFAPSKTFSSMRRSGEIASALVPGVILGTLGIVVGFLVLVASRAIGLPIFLPRALGDQLATLPVVGLFGRVWGLWIALSPLAMAAWILILGGIFHVMLLLVGAARAGFEATLGVTAYCYGATSVLLVVPSLGWHVARAWFLVIAIAGLRVVHGTTTARAAAAVLVPAIACLGSSILVFLLLASGLAGLR